MPALSNPRHEKFAQLVASGIHPAEAYVSLGYAKCRAAQAASRLSLKVDVKCRIAEILDASALSCATMVQFTRERVLSRLHVLSAKAEDAGQIGAAARCEELIGRSIAMFTDRTEGALRWDGDPSRLDAAQLKQLMGYLEALAFGDDKTALEQARAAVLAETEGGTVQ